MKGFDYFGIVIPGLPRDDGLVYGRAVHTTSLGE